MRIGLSFRPSQINKLIYYINKLGKCCIELFEQK